MKLQGPFDAPTLKAYLAKVDPALSFYLQSQETTKPGSGLVEYTVQGILSYPKSESTLYRAYQMVDGKWQPTTAPCFHTIEKLVKALVLNGHKVWIHKVAFTKYNATLKLADLKHGLKAKGVGCQCDGLSVPTAKPVSSLHKQVMGDTAAKSYAAFVTPAGPPVAPPEPPKPVTPFQAPPLDGAPLTGKVASLTGLGCRDIEAAVTGMYLLEELSLTLPLDTLPDAARARFAQVKHGYAETLARNLFDYLAMASIAEAAHCIGQTTLSGESHARSVGFASDPRSFLPVIGRAFNEGKWHGGYGGPKWGNIVKSASLYFSLATKPLMFADHCVDLAHNGGLAFNKGYILKNPPSQTHYFEMLNVKRDGSLLEWKSTLRVPASVAVVLEVFTWLGVDVPVAGTVESVPDTPIPPLKWGTKPFVMECGGKYAVSTVPPTLSSDAHTGHGAEVYVPRGK